MHLLLIWLSLILAPVAASAQSPSHAGTWRAQVGDAQLLVRAAADGRIDLHHTGTSRSASVATLVTAKGLTGLTPNGEVISLGDVLGRPHLLIGNTLLPLSPIAASEFSQAQRVATAPAPAPGSTGSLGGMSLFYAKSGNGYGQMRSFHFCSDGSFFYRFEELQSSQFGNGAGERNDSGTWTVSGGTLHVRFRGQGERSYAMQRVADGVIALDGMKYKVDRSNRCR
jgi:hypothetical protein